MYFSATPVTVLTGFLGAGKTTLINRLMRDNHGRRLAIVENEYGEIGVDSELLERCDNETVIQLDNGCVCCTVRGDLANALSRLKDDREAGRIDFDHVVIETTGLADPGPISRTFLAETALQEHYYLDGVVTLVDALHAQKTIAQRREARAQIAYADAIVVTKCDLADEQAVHALIDRLRRMNTVASVRRADGFVDDGGSPLDILDVRGFQLDRDASGPDAPGADRGECNSRCEAPDHNHDHDHRHDHDHLADVSSVHWQSDSLLDGVRFDAAMARLEELYPETLWRIKGMLNIAGVRQRLVVQGVNGLLQITPTTYWRPYEPRKSRLVFIGERLNREAILAMLDDAVLAPIVPR